MGNDAIGCDVCLRWIHPSPQCTGLRAAAIDCIQRDGGNGIMFKCSTCRCSGISSSNSPTNSNTNNNDLNIALAQVFEIVKSLAVNVAQMSTQMNLMLNNPISRQQNSMTNAASDTFSRSDLYVELREYEERKKRVRSVIVNGIVANNEHEFSDQFNNVCQTLINNSPTITDIHCINSDKRIYRVTLEDKDARIAILSSAKNLKNHPHFSRIYISCDLTFLQRQELIRKRASRRADYEQHEAVDLGAAASEVPATVANPVPVNQVSTSVSTSASNDAGVGNFH